MRCDVCGNLLHFRSILNLFRVGISEHHACSYCQAPFYRYPDGQWYRGPYPTIDRRWSDGVRDGTKHAVADDTLCGVAREDVTVYRHHWQPATAGACPACIAAAREIDARWPAAKRTTAVTRVELAAGG